MSEPNYGRGWPVIPTENQSTTPPQSPQDTHPPEGYMSREEVLELLAERDRRHAEDMAAVKSRLPVAMVPMHSGGPGMDNHQASWSLAEQEAALRGEVLDHWIIRD